jgi:hypothetical protein
MRLRECDERNKQAQANAKSEIPLREPSLEGGHSQDVSGGPQLLKTDDGDTTVVESNLLSETPEEHPIVVTTSHLRQLLEVLQRILDNSIGSSKKLQKEPGAVAVKTDDMPDSSDATTMASAKLVR